MSERHYRAESVPDSENWLVVNVETEEVKAVHEPPEAKEKAEEQVKLLEEIENDPSWEED